MQSLAVKLSLAIISHYSVCNRKLCSTLLVCMLHVRAKSCKSPRCHRPVWPTCSQTNKTCLGSPRLQLIKYGVMDRQAAIRDLACWESLYLAGRMHKPVVTLKSCTGVVGAQKRNVRAAIATALLLCSHSFTKMQFLHTLCGISYHGAELHVLKCCCGTCV